MSLRREQLARSRRALGYSQELLAQELGVATSTVVRWERGETTPQAHQWPALARILRIDARELQSLLHRPTTLPVVPPPPEPAAIDAEDDMDRRAFLAMLTTTATLVALPPAAAVEEPAERLANGADALNSHLWQVFGLSDSKQAVRPLVRHQLSVLAARLRDARSESHHRAAAGQVADLYQLAGEMAFDANRYTEAAYCYTLAAEAARVAGAYDLWACAMTRHSFVELYAGRATSAEPMLAAAARVAQRGDGSLATRYWVAAVQAEACAGLGDLDGCRRALDRAEEVYALAGPVHNGGWLRFDGSRLAEERGTCYLQLGRPDLAEEALTTALGQELSSRRRGAVLAELAALGAERRDIDQVMHYSTAALALAGQTESGWIGKKLEGVRGRLAPLMGDARVSVLHDQIAALGAARHQGAA